MLNTFNFDTKYIGTCIPLHTLNPCILMQGVTCEKCENCDCLNFVHNPNFQRK